MRIVHVRRHRLPAVPFHQLDGVGVERLGLAIETLQRRGDAPARRLHDRLGRPLSRRNMAEIDEAAVEELVLARHAMQPLGIRLETADQRVAGLGIDEILLVDHLALQPTGVEQPVAAGHARQGIDLQTRFHHLC